MYCTRKINDDIVWVGGDDRRPAMFEGVYSVPHGVSYNSYLVKDEKTVLFDTVDKAVEKIFFENVKHELGGRSLDYLVVQHMEPDHSATLITMASLYPQAQIICSKLAAEMIKQFFDEDISARIRTVQDGDTLESGRHIFNFYTAPMVHWPEVIVTYDATDKILFSADAFGTFGALNGAIFADEVDFYGEYLSEARRYYANIVGKYGVQVQALLKKTAGCEITMICSLHGFVHRSDIDKIIDKYDKWSSYTPEEKGVVIAYASIYGNTENAAQIAATMLRETGIKAVMFDVSVTPASEIIAACFRYSHLLFASSTYNAGIFVSMEELLHDIAAHALQNRTVAFMQNGSWAPASGKLMRKILEPLKNMKFIEESVTIKSSLKAEQRAELAALAAAVAASMSEPEDAAPAAEPAAKKYRCRICGYVYEGGEMPDDFKCPICGRGKEFFELIED